MLVLANRQGMRSRCELSKAQFAPHQDNIPVSNTWTRGLRDIASLLKPLGMSVQYFRNITEEKFSAKCKNIAILVFYIVLPYSCQCSHYSWKLD